MLRKTKITVIALIAAVCLTACNLSGILKNQKNLFGRYYDGALDEKQLKTLNKALAEVYPRIYKETKFKKPYIVGKCLADSILGHLPANAYQTFADWKIFIIESNEVHVSALGNQMIIISDQALKYFNYDQNVIAYVIAHVIAHSELDHLNERMALPEYRVENVVDSFRNNINNYQNRVMALAGEPVPSDQYIPYSTAMEDEADKLAISMMAAAGFDPNNLFVFLNHNVENVSSLYFKQHPMSQHKIDFMFSQLEKAVEIRDKAFKNGVRPQCSNIQ